MIGISFLNLALLYKQLTSLETFHTKHAIIKECTKAGDSNQSYQFATRELDGAFDETKQLNFFITQSTNLSKGKRLAKSVIVTFSL
jgi:hypothetical protein